MGRSVPNTADPPTFTAIWARGRVRHSKDAAKPETSEQGVMKSANSTDTHLSTHAAELVKIAAAWTGLSWDIQATVLTLVRVALANKTDTTVLTINIQNLDGYNLLYVTKRSL